jgi:hypothetical protein
MFPCGSPEGGYVIDPVKSWEDMVHDRAMTAADDILIRFNTSLEKAGKDFGKGPESKMIIAGFFMDAFVGALCLSGFSMTSNPDHMEKSILKNVKDKFFQLRRTSITNQPQEPVTVDRKDAN